MNVDEQNRLIQQAATSLAAFKEYLGQNLMLLRDYIMSIVRSVPVPVTFVLLEEQRALELRFICARQTERCIYHYDHLFCVVVQDWRPWLKISVIALGLGLAILKIDARDPVDQAREIYDVLRAEGDEDFLSFISQPFLTVDELAPLLADIQPENVLVYDGKIGNWICQACRAGLD